SWKGSASRTERRFFVGASSAAMFVESRRKGNAAQPLLRVCYPQDAEQEGVLQRHIPDALIAPAHAAMTRAKVGLEQQQVAVGLVAAQPGHPLGRLPVLNAAVVVPGD